MKKITKKELAATHKVISAIRADCEKNEAEVLAILEAKTSIYLVKSFKELYANQLAAIDAVHQQVLKRYREAK